MTFLFFSQSPCIEALEVPVPIHGSIGRQQISDIVSRFKKINFYGKVQSEMLRNTVWIMSFRFSVFAAYKTINLLFNGMKDFERDAVNFSFLKKLRAA